VVQAKSTAEHLFWRLRRVAASSSGGSTLVIILVFQHDNTNQQPTAFDSGQLRISGFGPNVLAARVVIPP
jgi:hypothetical protein